MNVPHVNYSDHHYSNIVYNLIRETRGFKEKEFQSGEI